MGKMIERTAKNGHAAKQKLTRLRRQRQKLAARLSRLDTNISRLAPGSKSPLSNSAFQRWLDQMSDGLPDLPPLPDDFGRADLYDDHD